MNKEYIYTHIQDQHKRFAPVCNHKLSHRRHDGRQTAVGNTITQETHGPTESGHTALAHWDMRRMSFKARKLNIRRHFRWVDVPVVFLSQDLCLQTSGMCARCRNMSLARWGSGAQAVALKTSPHLPWGYKTCKSWGCVRRSRVAKAAEKPRKTAAPQRRPPAPAKAQHA